MTTKLTPKKNIGHQLRFRVDKPAGQVYPVKFSRHFQYVDAIIYVTVPAEIEDPAICAELTAIRYILMNRLTAGESAFGLGMEIDVSFGAIKKLARGETTKEHLFFQGEFLGSQFLAAQISVSSSSIWTKACAVDMETIHLEFQRSPKQFTVESVIGPVTISRHAIERYHERVKTVSLESALSSMVKILPKRTTSERVLGPKYIEYCKKRYGQVPRVLYSPGADVRYVICEEARGLVLVTVHIEYEGNFEK